MPTTQDDQKFIEKFEAAGGDGIPYNELESCFKHKGFVNFELVQGDIAQSLPNYISKNPALKIALLHIDVDIYDPTKVILENLFDRVVSGGLIVLDDYGTVHGETATVDDFFASRNFSLRFHRLPYYKILVFIVK